MQFAPHYGLYVPAIAYQEGFGILTRPDALSRSGRVFLFAAAALFLLHAALLLAARTNPGTPLRSNLIQIVCPLMAAFAAIATARRFREFARHFWVLLAASFSIWTLAQILETYYENVRHASLHTPWPSDILFFISMAPAFGSLFIDREKGFQSDQWPRIFDLLQIVIFAIAGYLFTFQPPSAWQHGWGSLTQLQWTSGSTCDALLLVAFVVAAVKSRLKSARELYGRLVIFMTVYVCGEVPFSYLQARKDLHAGTLWDLGMSVPFLVGTVIAVTASPAAGSPAKSSCPSISRYRWRSWAPAHVASLIFPLMVLLMAAGIAEKQLFAAISLGVLSFGCSVARIIVAESQQLKSARDLEESNALLRSVFEGTGDALFIKDLQGRYVIANHDFGKMVNHAPEEVRGKNARDFLSVDEAKAVAAQDQLVLETGSSHTFETKTAAGDRVSVILSTKSPWRDANGKIVGVICVLRDVTEYRKMEAQLRQSQKMEAIGTLAGGVAHDFHNLLMVINGYSSVLAEALQGDAKLRGNVDQIMKAGERAASLTRQLLAFSRKQTIQPAYLNFNQIVTGIEKLLHRLIGEDIKVSSYLAPDLGTILADAGQMEQVILNLAVNARDAMPNGGELRFETRNVELDDSVAIANGLNPGRYIEFVVRDTGLGMDLSVQTRLFEPFFTTKPVGKGTGLGLSTVYGILKQANGHITFTSQPGHGTTFRIFLPRIDSKKPAATQAASMDSSLHGRETVLVVEDDLNVCELVRAVLDSHGYRVLTSARPEEAERLFQQHNADIDLLVSDVVMPEVSGTELAKRFSARNPRLKVLFMSGYIGDAIVRAGISEKDVAFLQKPFAPIALIRKVREVLDGTQVGEAEELF